jgi:Zn-dependent protease
MYKIYKIKRFPWLTTSKTEIKDLVKAWILVSLAFTIADTGLVFSSNLIIMFLTSAITVGLGFLLHELGHKVVAQKYHCLAEFRADDKMLFMAVLLSLLGFVFVAPGAVLIFGHLDKKKNGHVSIAGPLVNFALALVFLALTPFAANALLHTILKNGFLINSWIGLFNLIPIGNFDGLKILRWSKIAYIGMVVLGVVLLIANMAF